MRNAGKSQAICKGLVLAGGMLASTVLAPGCQSLSPTENGALAGTGLGAASGAIIGSAVGRAGPGAIIGGALGMLGGALTGAGIESAERRQAARLAAVQAARPPLSMQEVVQLTQSGMSDGVIVEQIRTSGSVYRLSAADLLYLQNSGVREPVIKEMQDTVYRSPRRIYSPVAATTIVEQPVYVVDPVVAPVGFGWGR